MAELLPFSGQILSSFHRFLHPKATSSLFRLVSVSVMIIPSSSSFIRSGTAFHSVGISNINYSAASDSLTLCWISDWVLLCIPSLSAIASGSGRMRMSRSGSGYNSCLLWSSGCSLTPTYASSIGIFGSSVNSPSSNHQSGSTSCSRFWWTTSSPRYGLSTSRLSSFSSTG